MLDVIVQRVGELEGADVHARLAERRTHCSLARPNAFDRRRERLEVALSSAAVLGYGEHRRRKIRPRSSRANAFGGEEWESNPPSSAWRRPPGLKPGRPTRIVSSPNDRLTAALTPLP